MEYAKVRVPFRLAWNAGKPPSGFAGSGPVLLVDTPLLWG
jgi:hypothetical protein